MRLQVKGKNVEVSDTLKAYAEEKLGKLDKHLNDAARLEVELAVEKNPSIAASQIAEGTIWTKGPVLRARESSSDMRASIDLLVEKLERQAQRYRDKRRPSGRRGNPNEPEAISVVADVETPAAEGTGLGLDHLTGPEHGNAHTVRRHADALHHHPGVVEVGDVEGEAHPDRVHPAAPLEEQRALDAVPTQQTRVAQEVSA